MFKLGDKVVCIKKTKWEDEDIEPSHLKYPRYGMILTIRKIKIVEGDLCFWFNEIINRSDWTDCYGVIIREEIYFSSIHFRKLDHKPFTNELTKELALKQITEQTEETVDVPEKELEEV